jgi:hypothetical protein
MILLQLLSMNTHTTYNPEIYTNNTKKRTTTLPTHMKGKLEEMKKNIQTFVLKK